MTEPELRELADRLVERWWADSVNAALIVTPLRQDEAKAKLKERIVALVLPLIERE